MSAASRSSSTSASQSPAPSGSSDAPRGGGSLNGNGLTNGPEDPNGSGLTSEEGFIGALRGGQTVTYTPGGGWSVTEDQRLRRERVSLMKRLRGRKP